MKNILKKTFILVSMLFLTGCGGTTPNPDQPNNDNNSGMMDDGEGNKGADIVVGDPVTTYLVLGKNGLLNGKAGTDVEAEHLEYTVTLNKKTGEELPTADQVTSLVEGVKFASWVTYENLGKPTKYTHVPSEDGKILYAFWVDEKDHPINPDIPTPDPDNPDNPDVAEATWYIVGAGSFVKGAEWDPAGGIPMEKNANPMDPKIDEHMKQGVRFEKGDTFKIAYHDKSRWVEKFETGKGSAFDEKLIELKDNGMGGYDAVVAVTGLFDLYLKDPTDGRTPTIWVQAHK